MRKRKRWIHVYEGKQEYGGPEEGGWWYMAWYPMGRLFSRPVKRANEARRKLRQMQEYAERIAKQTPPASAIIGGNPDDLDSRDDFDPNDMTGVQTGSDFTARLCFSRDGLPPRRPRYS